MALTAHLRGIEVDRLAAVIARATVIAAGTISIAIQTKELFYLKKVSASRKLLPDFEFLLKEAKAGSEPAQLEILQCLRKLGFKLAYQSGCIDRLGEEDAVQLARLGVLRAICDWHEGDDIHRFVAFAANKMRTELRTAMRRQVTADFMESGSSKAGMLALEARAYHEYQLSEQDRLRLWLVRQCFPMLSPRQRLVMRGLLLEGKTVVQLSGELHLDQRTVSLHRSRAIEKLQLLLGVRV
ncbi:sigma-70 family RNA polymerase sigma factor [Phascolarctobacterium sp.]|uniref:sigma-70 family RNA polymerase sigma factor n=1 Tax=Phascolarctobacterium sp. TaxID=2049039 RepID=UPI003076BE4E